MNNNHPTIRAFKEKQATDAPPTVLSAAWLRQLCLDAGADDVGFVEVSRPRLQEQKEDISRLFPNTKSLISIVCRMNREPIRNPGRSVANHEFHQTHDHMDDVTHKIVGALERAGIPAICPPLGFPMEMDRLNRSKIWLISHKPVAVEAGLGHMGLHRNVIHPQFGNFILLDTILLSAEIDQYNYPINYNPCLDCRLCVAACPVGAIEPDGSFHFSSCYTHNYREFLGGFNDWVETIADSKSVADYRSNVTAQESASMWQSLSFGPNYKAAYCMAVCPAGEDVIGPFLTDRGDFLKQVLKPLQDKVETIYIISGSDAEAHVQKRFPHKHAKRVANSLYSESIGYFLRGLPLVFQKEQAKGLNATYHFIFEGEEAHQATVTIKDQQVMVQDGCQGKADLEIHADSKTWLRFLKGEMNIVAALALRKIRLKGPIRLLRAFGKCFPK